MKIERRGYYSRAMVVPAAAPFVFGEAGLSQQQRFYPADEESDAFADVNETLISIDNPQNNCIDRKCESERG